MNNTPIGLRPGPAGRGQPPQVDESGWWWVHPVASDRRARAGKQVDVTGVHRLSAACATQVDAADVELPHLIVAFKKAVEPLTTHSLEGSGVQPVVLRIGTIWGPLVDPESPFFRIPPYISAVLRGEQPRPLHADDGGDCCYAPDAGRAIALLMTARTLRHGTYNVSSGRPFTNREFADALQAMIPGLRLDLLPGRQAGPGQDPYLDITRLTNDTGFESAFDVAAAVADYVAWRADNPR